MNNIALEVSHLSKCYEVYDKPQDRVKQALFGQFKRYYHEFWALKEVSFELKKGEALGVIGRNGSGKSTLLQLLCKTLTPTSGSIRTYGRIAALLELGAGFNPEFTGRENIYINGAILGFRRDEIESRFDEIIQFADIGNFIDQPVKSYSSGMFVRLAFAVQACVQPDILIIDEALAVGDVFFRQKCYTLLKEFLKKGVSIILVTHSMNEVEQFCQRALLLKNGLPIFLGPANEAVKRYYILEQEKKTLPITTTSIQSEYEETSHSKEFYWPSTEAFIELSNIQQVSNGGAECIGVAICDLEGRPCRSFQQGDTASFFYEFKLTQALEVPVTGIVLQNDKGINVHGKGTTEYGTPVPVGGKPGEILRIRQDITLELAIGEYTFECGLAALSLIDYEQRMHYSYTELYSSLIRLCHLPYAGSFAVLPRLGAEPVQLLHHGIANLPGNCAMIKLPTKLVENAL